MCVFQNEQYIKTLLWMHYNSRRPHQVPRLSDSNKNLSLQCAQGHRNWTGEDGQIIVWSYSSLHLSSFSDLVHTIALDFCICQTGETRCGL